MFQFLTFCLAIATSASNYCSSDSRPPLFYRHRPRDAMSTQPRTHSRARTTPIDLGVVARRHLNMTMSGEARGQAMRK